MPTKSRREDTFIERFLSAYENGSWADAKICWLDKKIDGAVEALATRRSDGKTLAIEHTIIEPFVSDKEDFAFFKKAAFSGSKRIGPYLYQDTGFGCSFRSGLCAVSANRPRETQLSMLSIAGSRRIGFLFAMAFQNIVARSLGFPAIRPLTSSYTSRWSRCRRARVSCTFADSKLTSTSVTSLRRL